MAECHFMVSTTGYSSFNLRQFGYQDCPPTHSFGPVVRLYYLLHFVVSGKGKFINNGKTYFVNPGELFVIHPGDEAYYEADREEPWSYIWIGFYANEALPLELADVIHCPEALHIFQQAKASEELSQSRGAFLSARLWDLFALLLEKENPPLDYAEYALNYIHSEYMKDISIEEIAKRLNLDRSYLYTIFKRKTGISPKKYLQNYRFEIAASLLTKSNVSISVVANSVGYPSIFTFSKMFKQHYSVSPQEYRKKNKK